MLHGFIALASCFALVVLVIAIYKMIEPTRDRIRSFKLSRHDGLEITFFKASDGG